MSAVWNYIKQFPVNKAIMTVILFLLCLIAVKVMLGLFDHFIKKAKIDALVCKILRILVKAFLLFTLVVIILSSLGISVTSLIAALSVIGVAFSLAIQDFLSNVFGGFQIISNHPFNVGDYVEAGGTSGSVCEVGLFYTKLTTPDKKLVQIPNSKIVNDCIINYSNSAERRVDFQFAASYDNDVEKVRSVVLRLLSEHPMVFHEEGKAPVVHVNAYRDNDVLYVARVWCENQNYWTVYYDVMNAIKPTFEKNGISFSYPHVNVHMVTK